MYFVQIISKSHNIFCPNYKKIQNVFDPNLIMIKYILVLLKFKIGESLYPKNKLERIFYHLYPFFSQFAHILRKINSVFNASILCMSVHKNTST